ncbi:MBL fold metallo-hydrolase [Paracraurococcus ruber]|uniref:MBL fold metallo-hydrolase n=1 Tax=Paracraurococcus ruber TaxID=77675 RepID=A0ABS1D1W7_9PROT|nr:MBL fold metallo-hydrolase [Paracraurococcus ruber]MBK1660415.1 MBL fold metallo-hydrolase [Paracraurococcus ruber]TDG27598.1 MBL fold metallo-hydrolase [Paracraurococcus ruber]
MRVTILGCGGSGGVPLLGGAGEGGEWGDCDPAEPRNRRTRTSCLIEAPTGERLLVDAGPDLRQQLLAVGAARLDAVLFTHAHADHILGIDDLRQVNRLVGRQLPAYATRTTLQKLDDRFDYAFLPPTEFFFRPSLDPRRIGWGERFEIAGMAVEVFRQDHGVMDTLGLRIGGFGYSTDVVNLPEESLAALQGLDTWVVGCFQHKPHSVHAHLEKVLDWVAALRPRRTVLTHMGPAMDYRALCRSLPPGVEPAHDGLVLEVPVA